MDYNKEASSVLQRISDELDRFITTDQHAGLLGGYTGCALFYAYYFQYTGNETHLDKVYALIENSISALSEQPMNGSHCGGIAGIAWTILHLAKLGYIDEGDVENAFEEIDHTVGEFMEAEMQEGRNDFLHQGVGTALYFLERLPDPYAAEKLTSLVNYLKKTAITTPYGISWKDNFSSMSEKNTDGDLFNLGLAHGVPAIMAILARIYEKGIAIDIVKPLIEDSVKWLLSAKNANALPGHSLYPVVVDINSKSVNDSHSRLGWCYGDLGIATALSGIGMRLQREDYKEEALRIFKNIVQHRDQKNGAVHDACMCHGSAGIAFILNQAATTTADPVLKDGAKQWLQYTLEMNTWADGPAGYKFFHHPDYTDSYNVLEGIAGIGLTLINFLDANTTPSWSDSMLIA
ncbi:MAG TPA: lanthionine synthetase C family protein [Chitinophaga sp.]|uniref:lanthionine synthetase C family protein n=1 Tax=Chitinophaga sp. TaxID=1869181 RepID=UPI002C90D42B|nr:lanthionine synthetase C family protein [Chitinophaga sp.]HVI45160.1 lanthionine synthetase C family protein [Chitinophaga sp.]